jgi:hypothetical protein
MHTLLMVLFILGLVGALIFELWLVMRMLAMLTSRHSAAQRDFAPHCRLTDSSQASDRRRDETFGEP